jgi:hypothetical protein
MTIVSGFKIIDLGSFFKVQSGRILDNSTEYVIQEATFEKLSGTGYVQINSSHYLYYTKNFNLSDTLVHSIIVQEGEISLAVAAKNVQVSSEYYLSQAIINSAIQSITVDDISGLDDRIRDYVQEYINDVSGVTIRLEYKIVQHSKVLTDFNINKIINVYVQGLGELDLKDLTFVNNEITLNSSLNTKEIEILYIQE